MKFLPNLLIKTGKSTMIFLGSITVTACLGLGLFGVTQANENKSQINSLVAKASEGLNNFDTELSKINQINFDELNKAKEQITNFLNEAEKTLNAELKNVEDYKNKIINSLTDENIKKQLSESIDSMISQLKSFLSNIPTIKDQINNAVNIDEIKTFLSDATSQISTVSDEIKSLLNKITPSEVNHYYDLVSKTLLIIGGVLLGLVALGTSLSFIFYKDIDGKMVNRLRAKKELYAHLENILKKHPNIIEEIRKRR